MLVTAIITAAGKGKRMGGGTPKQFLPLGDKPLLTHTIIPFQNHQMVSEIILVAPQETIPELQRRIIKNNNFTKVKKIVAGGVERADSVYNGLLNTNKDTDYVLIHDGVRPFIDSELISRILNAARQYGCAIPGLPAEETVKTTDSQSFVGQTLDRAKIFTIQTPQAFRFDLFLSAYERSYKRGDKVTDDSQLLESGGHQVRIVTGEKRNIKITTPYDLEYAEFILRARFKKEL